jgi:hypothetical protein
MMLDAAARDPQWFGHIVNTASMAGLLTAPNMGIYNAAKVAQAVFESVEENRFYIFSHPKALGNVQERFEHIVAGLNPADPFLARPEIGDQLRSALRNPSSQ